MRLVTYKIPNNYKSNCVKELGQGNWIYCLEDLHAIVENGTLRDVVEEKKIVKECLKNERNKDWNVFKNTWSYNSFAGANDTKIQNIIGKDVEPHSCWYWTKSISFHWFINFGFWPFLVELISLSTDLKLSTFSAHCFFPDILNMILKIKQDNLIPTSIAYRIQNPQILYWIVTQHHKSHPLSVVPLSLSFIYNQCNHHQKPLPPPITPQSTTTAKPQHP